jgi:hypothetical protein
MPGSERMRLCALDGLCSQEACMLLLQPRCRQQGDEPVVAIPLQAA